MDKKRPGVVRDAIIHAFHQAGPSGLSLQEVTATVEQAIGPVSGSSVRSYLNLNTPGLFERTKRGAYRLAPK